MNAANMRTLLGSIAVLMAAGACGALGPAKEVRGEACAELACAGTRRCVPAWDGSATCVLVANPCADYACPSEHRCELQDEAPVCQPLPAPEQATLACATACEADQRCVASWDGSPTCVSTANPCLDYQCPSEHRCELEDEAPLCRPLPQGGSSLH